MVCSGAPPNKSTVETLVERAGDLGIGEEDEPRKDRSSELSRSREALLVRETNELRNLLGLDRLLVLVVRLRRNSGEGGAMGFGYRKAPKENVGRDQ